MRNLNEFPKEEENAVENTGQRNIVPFTTEGSQGTGDTFGATFLEKDEIGRFREQWSEIQSRFVDEPRQSVEDADSLVDAVVKRAAEMFSDRRRMLEARWREGDSVSTEDLRVALQKYRAFFSRMLSI
jgi:pyridoxal/pyridoxine/pyridoxamine kinase